MAEESPLKRGNALLAEGDHVQAIEAFQEALKAEPSADAHEALARAYIKGESYLEAAEAALKAITLDGGQAKAYLRRGIALFHLEEFESALEAFQKGKELRPTLAAFDTWTRKCRAEIDGEVEVVEPPPERPPGGPKITFVNSRGSPRGSPSPSPPDSPVAAHKPARPAPKVAPDGIALPVGVAGLVPAPNSIRHQWYQLGNKVVVDVYAKGLDPARFTAAFGERTLRLAVARTAAAGVGDAAAGGEGPEWELDVQLFGAVDVGACKYEVLRTKVEVTLPKVEPGRAWPTLEKSDKPALPLAAPAPAPAPAAMPAAPGAEGAAGASGSAGGAGGSGGGAAGGPPRAYPSSHVKNPKDWSALEREVKEMESKGELDDGDPLNSFFSKIFSQGDEDTRRAMMKSFVESNGTVLSTNWTEVGKKKVECTPPEGMDVKKWGE
ncbi:MAG: SGS domain-containing protein [Monoraphidium minutum]|nr:MAG: SGS domain-containing protein [Monoraphidium minutum]